MTTAIIEPGKLVTVAGVHTNRGWLANNWGRTGRVAGVFAHGLTGELIHVVTFDGGMFGEYQRSDLVEWR